MKRVWFPLGQILGIIWRSVHGPLVSGEMHVEGCFTNPVIPIQDVII